jgi:cytoskeletal protein CcmA (bactofilin family)
MSDQSGQRQTVIDEGTGFKGDFNSDCPIVVKGRIEGQMTAPSLTVDATGSVSGVVKVKELRSQGEIAGEYDADYVQLSGTVKDNTVIRARTLEVNLTPQSGRMQVTFGQCELEVGDVPTKAEAVAKAEAPAPAPAATRPAFESSTSPGIEPPPPAPKPVETDPIATTSPLLGEEAEPKGRKGREGRRSTSPPPAK